MIARLVGLVFLTALDALFIWWLLPATGIPYHPTYWQAWTLSVLITITVSTPIMLRGPVDDV